MLELLELLEHVRAFKPLGDEVWKGVEAAYNTVAEVMPQMTQLQWLSLKQKFVVLVKSMKPTGSGEMPTLVRQAKEINTEIHYLINTGQVDENEEEI